VTASASQQPDRYFFVHMQKTAGIALRRRLAHHFGHAAVYPTHGVDGNDPVKPYLSIEHLCERMAARGDEIRVITGHFPLCTTELLDGRFKTLTLLREPVERTLSWLRYRRKRASQVRGKPLEEIYERPLEFNGFLHNHMTKMLSLRPEELTMGMLTHVEFTREHLERAKEALVGIDAVGFQEHFEDFCDELATRFGWRLAEPKTVNTTDPVEVPEGLRDRIAEDNALDVELYEFAKGLLREGRRSRPGEEPLAAVREEQP
jgi:hypothetical protein